MLGLALLLGGLRRERQTFDRAAAAVGSTMLALATIGLIIPAIYHMVLEAELERDTLTAAREMLLERELSVEIAVVLFATYVLHLLFSLRTHTTSTRASSTRPRRRQSRRRTAARSARSRSCWARPRSSPG